MSFALKAKNEILSDKKYLKKCCLKAELYGIMLFANTANENKVRMITENEEFVHYVKLLLLEIAGIKANVIKRGDLKQNGFVIEIEDKEEIKKISDTVGNVFFDRQSGQIDRAIYKKTCCAGSLLRGIFLCAGTISDPGKSYHLEFEAPDGKMAFSLCSFLQGFDLSPKIIVRRNRYSVYFKESSNIEDILNIAGAKKAAFELMDIKVLKDVRNSVNRRTNCDTANIGKTVNASVMQCEAINEITNKIGLSNIPPILREAAALRINNPEMSLNELCGLMSEPISKSGLNHRMNRLIALAKEIK